MNYKIFTFGCQMNKSDSERIEGVLEKLGFQKTQKEKNLDLIVVNMCAVRQSAVDRIYGLAEKFKKLKNENPKLKTVLTGCIPQKDFEKLKHIFDFILPIKTLPFWSEYLKKNKLYYPIASPFNIDYLKQIPKYSKGFSVFIPISSGCNNYCTYCIVPFVRGPLICRPHTEILEEVKKAIKNAAKEIWFLGQNVNEYISPTDRSINFAKLLKTANEINGNFWIRFTSPHPKKFSKELINTIAKSQKITPYINLPLQSGDNEILRKMNRNYTAEEYLSLIKKIRFAFKKFRRGLEKNVAISTDIIVGFPGESEKNFQNTVKIFKKVKFDMAYISQYSSRPGTSAEKLKNDVPQKEKKRRWKILAGILKKIALEKNKKFVGKTIEILVEKAKDNFLIGKSRHYKTVKFKKKKAVIGEFTKVKIVSALSWGLKGQEL